MPLYGPAALAALNAQAGAVQAWIDANPGGTAQACATEMNIPIQEVYYLVDSLAGYVDLPETADQYHAQKSRR